MSPIRGGSNISKVQTMLAPVVALELNIVSIAQLTSTRKVEAPDGI